jgi:small subunit ribosomal protein S16
MVKIRLMRVGKKKQPSFRVVIADSRSPRDGRIIESIGHYNPRLEPSGIDIDNDRALHWLKVGAQPSDQVRKLLQISGAWAEFTGEAPPPIVTSEERKRKATPAASVATEATPEESEASDQPEAAVTAEAVDQAPAAPEAEVPEQSSEEGEKA